MFKRFLCFILAILFCISLVGCSGGGKEEKEGFDIVCTVFPIYDWVRSCVGETEGITVSLLVDSGTDTHSYTPSTEDVIRVLECDMLFCVGGVSEDWLEKALSNHGSDGPKVIKLLELLGDKRLGAQEHTEDCGDDCHEEHAHGGSGAYDEHIWLSLKNAESLCGAITDALIAELPEASEDIKKSSDAYIEKIKELDLDFESALAKSKNKTLLFADRFPFVYLARDYSLDCHAAFSGCSSDTDVNFETVISLAETIDSLSLSSVIVLESSNKDLAQTVIAQTKNKNAEILTVDSMQSIGAKAISNGASYIDIMQNNLAVFISALS